MHKIQVLFGLELLLVGTGTFKFSVFRLILINGFLLNLHLFCFKAFLIFGL